MVSFVRFSNQPVGVKHELSECMQDRKHSNEAPRCFLSGRLSRRAARVVAERISDLIAEVKALTFLYWIVDTDDAQ